MWLTYRESWGVLFNSALAFAFSLLLYFPLKRLIGRVRPCNADRNLIPDHPYLDQYSCPSGHVMNAIAVALPAMAAYHNLMVPLGLLLFLIGWARIACAHHYITDVLAGYILGTACGSLALMMAAKLSLSIYG
jgi:undecaprenyl-diphosphatase